MRKPATRIMAVLVLVALATLPLVAWANAPLATANDSPAGNTPAYAPGRILVKFTPEAMGKAGFDRTVTQGKALPGAATGLASVDALSRDGGVTRVARAHALPRREDLGGRIGVERWFRFDVSGGDLEALAARMAADPNVEAATPDYRAFPAMTPNDPLFADNWGHANTGQLLSYDWATYSHENGDPVGTPGFDAKAPAAWDALGGYGDSGVVIAILDSGVDVDHPDLHLVAGYDCGDNDTNPDDNSADPGHGTCCAGVAAATGNNNLGVVGVAAGCSVMPVKIADSGGTMYFSYIQDGLYWAADHGADVISMSLGAPISSDPATDDAIQYAYEAGVTILAATGNENMSTISYPAINPYVIGVGAASPCGDRKRSSSSRLEVNPGVDTDPLGYTCDGERWWGSNYGVAVQDAAGAVDVLAPTILPTTDIGGNGGYVSGDYEMWFNGTSCATPYAAGVCALILSANPGYTPAQVREALVSSATDVVNVESPAGWDRWSGYGLVDASAAVGGGGPVAPTAAFVGAPTSGTYPLAVSFTDQSSGAPTAWSWDFGDGGVSSLQNPSHTYAAVGSYTVTLTVSNAVGGDDEVKAGYVTVTEPGVTTFVTASGETSVVGTATGTYAATVASDDVRETITESQYTGHPVKTYSYLEHRWSFALPAGGDATFHLEASRAANAEGDDFAFDYSVDGGVTWLPLVTVAAASDQAYAVPLGPVTGAVEVRVVDTNRSWGATALDAVAIDYMAFEVGDAQPVAPTADFAGAPTGGEYPLAVQFTDASTGDPTGWSWSFGDGGTAAVQNPSHTYTAAGVYTVSLTASNAQGEDTVVKTDYITVTEPGTGGSALHVYAMTVSRVKVGPNYKGSCVVALRDDGGQPVANATVSAAYDGATSGTVSGVTGADGTVTLQSGAVKKPVGEWCFEVTDVTHATLGYDSAANVTTRSCESGDVFAATASLQPREFRLGQNHPNPFNPMTEIRFQLPSAAHVRLMVYNIRGEVVATLVDRSLGRGEHVVPWNASDAPSGVYFYTLDTAGYRDTKRMVLIK